MYGVYPISAARSYWAIRTWRGEATVGEPSWLAMSQRTIAVRSSHGIRRSVAMSGTIAKSP